MTDPGTPGIFRWVNGRPVFVPARRPTVGEACLLYPVNGDYLAVPLARPNVTDPVIIEPVNGRYVALPFLGSADDGIMEYSESVAAILAYTGIGTSVYSGDVLPPNAIDVSPYISVFCDATWDEELAVSYIGENDNYPVFTVTALADFLADANQTGTWGIVFTGAAVATGITGHLFLGKFGDGAQYHYWNGGLTVSVMVGGEWVELYRYAEEIDGYPYYHQFDIDIDLTFPAPITNPTIKIEFHVLNVVRRYTWPAGAYWIGSFTNAAWKV